MGVMDFVFSFSAFNLYVHIYHSVFCNGLFESAVSCIQNHLLSPLICMTIDFLIHIWLGSSKSMGG